MRNNDYNRLSYLERQILYNNRSVLAYNRFNAMGIHFACLQMLMSVPVQRKSLVVRKNVPLYRVSSLDNSLFTISECGHTGRSI